MRCVLRTTLALVVLLAGAGLSPGQNVLDENPYYLRADKRLQVTLNVEAKHPKLAQIIAKLHDVTGLDLVVDPSLQDHDPDYGVVQTSKHGYYAWQLMEMVAKRGLKRGYWDKTDQGYRLMGTSVASVARSRPEVEADDGARLRFIWLVAIGAALLLILLVQWTRSRRAVRAAKRASTAPKPSS